MKKLLLFFTAAALCATFAQGGLKSKILNHQVFSHDPAKGLLTLENNLGRKLQVLWSKENTTPSFIGGKLTSAGYSNSVNRSDDAVRFLSANTELFGIKNPAQELRLSSSFTDELLMTHIKYDQIINGIRIYPSQLIVHFNSDGSIESINGNYIPTPAINTTPSLSENAAISIAKSSLNNFNASSAELIIFRDNINLLLAYEVNLTADKYNSFRIVVDAMSGKVIEKDDGKRYDGPAVGSGIGLNGSVRTLNTYLSGGKYYLVNAALPMYVPPFDSLKGVIDVWDAHNDTSGSGYNSASLVFDPNNDNNFNDNVGLKASVDAHYFVEKVYKFLKQVYNRNSYNNAGGSLENVVHYGIGYNNAYWSNGGKFMTYGDGDGVHFSNLCGGYDVIAHELTHGVTGATAQLVYHVQPGAINESVSDVFASIMDSTNWLIGEDVYTPGTPGDALRSMQDPHNGWPTGMGDWQPAHMDEFVVLPDDQDHDWGGVHTNSGIPNKAFYNVAVVTGHYKAGRIWYRALTTYLTNNSQFIDLRVACINSAKDIFGAGSAEETAVKNGFDAVGIDENSGSILELIYDDGFPESYVYENAANWQLAVKLTPPTNNSQVQQVKIYIAADANNGTGHFSLTMFEANNSGLPGTVLLDPYSYTPSVTGWQVFDITGMTVTKDFFVSMLYDGTNWAGVGSDNPPGNNRAYEFDPGINSWYKLTSPNNYTLFMRAKIKSITSIVEIDTKVPAGFEVTQNYPNPFNPITTIRYSLPEATDVRIEIYDVNGAYIAELANNFQNPGTYTITWNGRNNNGVSVSSGVYYTRVKAGNYQKTTKMVLMK